MSSIKHLGHTLVAYAGLPSIDSNASETLKAGTYFPSHGLRQSFSAQSSRLMPMLSKISPRVASVRPDLPTSIINMAVVALISATIKDYSTSSNISQVNPKSESRSSRLEPRMSILIPFID